MFSTLKQRIILSVYVFLVLSIPAGAYLASQRQTTKSSAKEVVQPKIKIATSSARPKSIPQSNLLQEINQLSQEVKKDDSTTTTATFFGPTLSFKLTLEGRPDGKMNSKIFVGISDATSSTLKYLLTFNVDLPDSGLFKGLSLAGLTAGNKYNAYIKGPAQIATSSAFTANPAETNLNSGKPIFLISGDLNEDNTVNSADYAIVKAALGSNPKSANWNENADLNKDGLVNVLDLSIIIKNMAKTGDSGVWVSPTPATRSGTPSGGSGYWIKIP